MRIDWGRHVRRAIAGLIVSAAGAVMAAADHEANGQQLYICDRNGLTAQELGPVKFMPLIDRDPTNPSNAWPISITQTALERWMKSVPANTATPFMLDREDAAFQTMLYGTGKAQTDAANWFGRMMTKALDYRQQSPLAVWYVAVGYKWPKDTFDAWWSGGVPGEAWAQLHFQMPKLAPAFAHERSGIAVAIYAPVDDTAHTEAYARLSLAPFLALGDDIDRPVYAIISDRLYNGRPASDSPELSDECIRAQIRAAKAAVDSLGRGQKIAGIIYWNADDWFRRSADKALSETQLASMARMRHARTVKILLEETGHAVPAALAALVAPLPAPPPATQPAPTPVPVVKTQLPPQKLRAEGGGDHFIINRIINNADSATLRGYAIEAIDVNLLEIADSDLDAFNYAIWFEGNTLRITRSSLRSHFGGDDYCVRAYPVIWRSSDSVFDNGPPDGHANKACVRVIGCVDFISQRDTFRGGRLMLGGGPAVESIDQQPFVGVIEDAIIDVETIEVYAKSKVTFIGCDFTGTGHCTPWTGCEIIAEDCTRNGLPLTTSFFRNNAAGVTIRRSQPRRLVRRLRFADWVTREPLRLAA